MKRIFFSTAVLAAALLVSGCGTVGTDGITQVATIDALLCGVYDGHLSLAQVGRHGDFGIGTFETNVPGYHMHFLADDLGGGGHVLAFTLAEGTLELDTVHDWLHVVLPGGSDAFATADLSRDRTRELEAAEK